MSAACKPQGHGQIVDVLNKLADFINALEALGK